MSQLPTPTTEGEREVATFPLALQALFKPKRYKVVYGGRGAGRSWGVARALLMLNLQKPERTLCARELQNSIKDSVHRLLSDQISNLKMNYLYDIQQAVIKGVGACSGAEFGFEGIRANADKIKSYEGVKRCWVEEANKTTNQSWKDLIPTIRREDSEILATFNPELRGDATYQRFVVKPPGDDAIVTPLLNAQGEPTGGTCTETFGPNGAYVIWNSYRDNPWFPRVLYAEMDELRRRNYDEYLHVWEGHCKQNLEGAVYADELRELRARGGICRVPYDRGMGVNVYLDLGRADFTAMWFEQRAAWEHRFIRFHKAQFKDLDYYTQYIQNCGYTIDTVWLPHDARAKRLGSKMSIEEQFREKGFYVRIVPSLSVVDGINAARSIFPRCYFDEAETQDGLQDLAHYRYDIDAKTQQYSQKPLHDEHSDGADAFRYAAIASRMKVRRARELVNAAGDAIGVMATKAFPTKKFRGHVGGGQGWLR